MNPRPSVLPLFAAVVLIPGVLPSVARAQAASLQTYEANNREAAWLADEQISPNGDSLKPSQITPADLAYLERARALVKENDIAAARLIFTRSASNGIAEAAFKLGQTQIRTFYRHTCRGPRAGPRSRSAVVYKGG